MTLWLINCEAYWLGIGWTEELLIGEKEPHVLFDEKIWLHQPKAKNIWEVH